jgi:hypothetical protein
LFLHLEYSDLLYSIKLMRTVTVQIEEQGVWNLLVFYFKEAAYSWFHLYFSYSINKVSWTFLNIYSEVNKRKQVYSELSQFLLLSYIWEHGCSELFNISFDKQTNYCSV